MARTHPLDPTRRVVCALLLVWLSAGFAGWAHACLAPPPAAAAAGGHHAKPGVATHSGAGRDAPAASQGGPDPAGPSCADSCPTGQRLAVRSRPSTGDSGTDAALSPPAGLGGWPARDAASAAPRWRPLATPSRAGPPVFIAFLRLTR